MSRAVISRDPDVMGGTPVFAGTRVPVQTLLDCLEAGETIDGFLRGFPGVSRSHVMAFLEEAGPSGRIRFVRASVGWAKRSEPTILSTSSTRGLGASRLSPPYACLFFSRKRR